MPSSYLVTGCQGNYSTDSEVSVFRFSKDDEMRKKWLRAIPRTNYVLQNASLQNLPVLPCLPDLKSGCEEEILLLLKEVDFEFQRKNHELLKELINARKLCKAQSDEIEKLSRLFLHSQPSQNELVTEKTNLEIEKLKNENVELKSENCALRLKSQKLPEMELQLESLKKSLSLQQDENKVLIKLLESENRFQSLRNNDNRMINLQHSDGTHYERNQIDNLSSTKESEIAQTAEKFLPEEKDFCDDFISKINQEIDNLDKKLQREIS